MTTKVTPKQLEIINLIYSFRFLTSHQIQHFLNHKNHSLISIWLKDLVNKKILNKISTKSINKTPAIYYLGPKSRSILINKNNINTKNLTRIYSEKNMSEKFRQHWIFIADLYFTFQDIADQKKITFLTSTDQKKYAYLPLPLPDAYIKLKFGGKNKRYFLDVFDNKPMFVVRNRINQYIRYYEDNYWQENHKHPFPKILLICPSVRVINSLSRYISEKVDEETDIEFYLALKDSISLKGITDDTWIIPGD